MITLDGVEALRSAGDSLLEGRLQEHRELYQTALPDAIPHVDHVTTRKKLEHLPH